MRFFFLHIVTSTEGLLVTRATIQLGPYSHSERWHRAQYWVQNVSGFITFFTTSTPVSYTEKNITVIVNKKEHRTCIYPNEIINLITNSRYKDTENYKTIKKTNVIFPIVYLHVFLNHMKLAAKRTDTSLQVCTVLEYFNNENQPRTVGILFYNSFECLHDHKRES